MYKDVQPIAGKASLEVVEPAQQPWACQLPAPSAHTSPNMAWNEPSLWEKPRRDPVQPNWEEGETSTFTLALPQALPPGQETPQREKPKLSAKEGWSREQENDVSKILEWKADRRDFSFLPTAECSGRERSKLSGDSVLANGASSISKTGAEEAETRQVGWRSCERRSFSFAMRRELHLPQYLLPAPSLPPDEGFRSPGVWLPQLPSPSFFALLSKHRQPGSQPPGRKFGGSFSRKLTGSKELTYIFWYFEGPHIRARTISHPWSVNPAKKPALHPHGVSFSC